jgi:hypothetical protein
MTSNLKTKTINYVRKKLVNQMAFEMFLSYITTRWLERSKD